MSRKTKQVSVYFRARREELIAVINWVSSSLVKVPKYKGLGPNWLTEKLVFDKTYETIGVGGSHWGIHGYAKLPCYSLYRRSTTVSLENYPLYSLKVFFLLHVAFGLGSGFDHILDPHIFFKHLESNFSAANAIFRHATPFQTYFFEGGGRMVLRWKGGEPVAT